MKKLILLLVSVILLQQANAQSFQKGSIVIAANYGIDGYRIQEKYTNKSNNISKDTTGGAASTNWNLGAEYGLFNWLGVGLQLKLDNYFHDTNTTNDIGFEAGVVLNIHIIRAQHFNLVAGFDIGLSTLTINYTQDNIQVYGSGSWVDFHISPRFYFGRFGLNLNLYFPTINYANLTTNVSSFNQYIASSWKGNGDGISFGIQYRIIN